MSKEAFLSSLQKVTGEGMGIAELITAAMALSEPSLAEQLYKVWIGLNPEHPQLSIALFNCSGLQSQSGDLAGARASLERAIAVNPDFLPAYINLGGLIERAGGADQAIALWRAGLGRPVPINGQNISYVITLLKQLSRILSEGHQLDLAEVTLQQCLGINPDQRDVIEQYLGVRLSQCKWPVVVPAVEGQERKALVRSMAPLSLAAYTDDPMLQLASAWNYVRNAVPDSTRPELDRRNARVELKGRRLRVGYVSSDLRDHAIGYLMAELFELHDKDAVEVFAYYCGRPNEDALKGRIKAAVEHWRDIRDMSDAEAARLIAADGVDILVDVNGHTRDCRTALFAMRPAPVQVNWLGYPGTMGTPYHHYIIADEWIIPPENEIYFSEKVLRLPCYQANDRKRAVAPHRPSRAEVGLPENVFVFCCFNGHQKISRFTFDRWMEILRRTPDSVLWLLETGEAAMDALRRGAQERGVDPSRLVFAAKLQNAYHLARIPLADLSLDSAPYGAHTTATDALWMAVPVLTLSGRSFASRVCGSLVRSAGAPELVCEDPAEFVEKAVELAAAPEKLKAIRARLEAGRDSCDLFNMDQLVAKLEGLYRTMAAEHRRGATPQPDLTNLERYLEIGIEFDHEGEEMLVAPDYAGLYRTALAARHLARPIAADNRLWRPEDIEAADGAGASSGEAAAPKRAARV